MKISIVTPNYNYGEFLIKAIKNVFAQTEAEDSPIVEHIIVDGGSTDNSVIYMQEWDSFIATIPEERKARYSFSWVSEKDRGQTDAINKGLRKSSGDIVCWLNADEFYLPNKLKVIENAFKTNRDVDFIYGEPLYVDDKGKPIRIKRDHIFSRNVLLYYGCYIASCSSFWRKKILDDGIYLDDSYKVTMDQEYWSHICHEGYKFKFIPYTIAGFTWHDNNVSKIYDNKRKEEDLKVRETYNNVPFLFKKHRNIYFKVMYHISYKWRLVLVLLRLIFMHKESFTEISNSLATKITK